MNKFNINPKDIKNSRELTKLLKSIGINQYGKELLYDINNNIIGFLNRSNKVILFTDKQNKDLNKIVKEI